MVCSNPSSEEKLKSGKSGKSFSFAFFPFFFSHKRRLVISWRKWLIWVVTSRVGIVMQHF